MNSTLDQIRYTPIIEFLELLRSEGFDVGVDSYLDFYQVLTQLPEDVPITSYSSFLAPLVCKNEAEQSRFYELFHAHGQSILSTCSEEQVLPPIIQKVDSNTSLFSIDATEKDLVPSTLPPKTISKRSEFLKWLVLASTILIGVELLFYPISNYYASSTTSSPKLESQDVPIPSKKENTLNTETVESTDTDYVEHKAPTKLDYFRDPSRKLDFESKAVDASYPYALPNRVDDDFWYQLYQNSSYLKYSAVFSILFLFLFTQIRKRNKKTDWTKQTHSKAPFSLRLQIPEVKQWPMEETFQKLAKLLNIRRETDRKELDITKTVNATIKNAGQWDFRFSRQKEAVEYLFLIDKSTASAPQARFFDQVYQQLKQADVPISRFYYEELPLFCWNEAYTDTIPLEEIYAAYHKHHLVLCSDGASLIDPETGQIGRAHV